MIKSLMLLLLILSFYIPVDTFIMEEDEEFALNSEHEYLIESENKFYIGIGMGDAKKLILTKYKALAAPFKIVLINNTSKHVAFELQHQPDGLHYISSDNLDCHRQNTQNKHTYWKVVQAIPTEIISERGISPYFYIQSITAVTLSENEYSLDAGILKRVLFNDILGDLLSISLDNDEPSQPFLLPMSEIEQVARFRLLPVHV